ncbi:major facilitator superfamily domain-containing protein 8 [Harmonia axyridis]|uniref:major facilitator superfamily domain-containing protein 8 n=1 Tax=Harmonia axyridis TaxID=115357 RepID=UPI001E278F35|nr:major facilitator superfamily domain-containing protein 8 [Harmonia axyridis]XP_045467058.1 major facilitator superfamily domain-containing protein 8 [Harmonia axyridis]
MERVRNTAKLIREKWKTQFDPPDDLENEKQYKERWRSIYIIYFTMFSMSLGFSIIVTGVWPYLDRLDPLAGKEFMGYIVAANPFAQMLFSPLVGWWSNKLGNIRIPVVISLMIFAVSSAMYSSIEMLDDNRKYYMLASRFLVGVSSANIAICRSYLAAATRYSERTGAVSMISLAQVIGFIMGPAIQAAVVPIGDDGFFLIKDKLKIDMYTACGWISVLIAIINMYMFLPNIFREHKIAGREAMLKQKKDNIKDTYKLHKPNYFATWTLIVSFFIIVFNFMLLETLATPLTMDQFAWSKSESLKYTGILISVGAVISIITSLAIPHLSKHFSEVKIMVWGGFFFMVLGRGIYIPFNNEPPPIYDNGLKLNLTFFCDRTIRNSSFDENNFNISELNVFNFNSTAYEELLENNRTTELIKIATLNCGDDLLGCPSTQEWCSEIPALTITNFVIGLLLTTFGYPMGITLIQTLVSKHLGTRPQGVWMGLLTGAGCLSRVLGPVCVTHIYEEYGTIWTFGITTAMMVATLLWLFYFEEEITPKEIVSMEEEGEELNNMASNKERKDQENHM